MATGTDGIVPTTFSGKQHQNLPTMHVDGGLTNTRNIEGIPLNGGVKVVRLFPCMQSQPEASRQLKAFGLLLTGCQRYCFVPEEAEFFNRPSGAAAYKATLPAQAASFTYPRVHACTLW